MSLPTPLPAAQTRRVLLILACAAFASQASMRIADPMLPALGADFGTPATEAAFVVTSFTIGYGVLQILWGPLADRLGKLRIVSIAALGAALASLLCALAPGLGALAGLRALSGAFCAGLIPLALAWIGDQIPYERRQEVLVQFMAGSTAGLVFGQAAGGLFADTLGWRGAFAVLAVGLGFAAVLLFRERAAMRRQGIEDSRATTLQGGFWRSLAPFGEVLAIAWARWVLLFVLIEGAFVFGSMAFVPTALHLNYNMPLWVTGFVVAGYGAGGLAYALLARWIIPRLGERGLALAGGGLLCLGLATLGGPHAPLEGLKTFAAGAGFFMMHSTLQTLATQMAPAIRGTAIATFAFSLFGGQTLGIASSASVVQQLGFQTVFLISAVTLAGLSLAIFVATGLRARQAAREAAASTRGSR